jgi:hypothetical protein
MIKMSLAGREMFLGKQRQARMLACALAITSNPFPSTSASVTSIPRGIASSLFHNPAPSSCPVQAPTDYLPQALIQPAPGQQSTVVVSRVSLVPGTGNIVNEPQGIHILVPALMIDPLALPHANIPRGPQTVR